MNKDNEYILVMKCVGNTCKLIKAGKCENTQPVNDVKTEFPYMQGKTQLPDTNWEGWTMLMSDNDEE